VQGGAVRVNDEKIGDPTRMLAAGDVTADGFIKLSMGKKRHALIVPE
jgi:tyrosyl-tRNA synthetase